MEEIITTETETILKKPAKDPQGKKWLVTINNPEKHLLDHEEIKTLLCKLPSIIYYCMADEIGLNEQTPHTHIYIACGSAVRFSTLQKLFNGKANLDRCKGTSAHNRDYVSKSGAWANTDKAQTSIPDTFEEWGEIPSERPRGGVESAIFDMIENGATNAEIIRQYPEFLRGMRDVENVRQMLIREEARTKWRNLETIYIWGSTGVGKTRSVMEGFGDYSAVYQVTDYTHPFDGYQSEDVIIFDEFSSSLRTQDMNLYLDGYPVALPARYNQKWASYTKCFIISNICLSQQYTDTLKGVPKEVRNAFIRRIHKVRHFKKDGTYQEYDTKDYLDNHTTLGALKNFQDSDESPQTENFTLLSHTARTTIPLIGKENK